jgi:hypothetical protein
LKGGPYSDIQSRHQQKDIMNNNNNELCFGYDFEDLTTMTSAELEALATKFLYNERKSHRYQTKGAGRSISKTQEGPQVLLPKDLKNRLEREVYSDQGFPVDLPLREPGVWSREYVDKPYLDTLGRRRKDNLEEY